jgi:starch synthase
MKILYCALAIDIAGSHGGATHVAEVTNGLAALGHDLWVIGGRSTRSTPIRHLHARITTTAVPPSLAWLMTPQVRRVVHEWQPDTVIERFYTFAGGGIIAAHAGNIPSILEVNAPVIDPPGTRKDRIDSLTGRTMRRWATQQCRWADRIVTPLATTVPPEVRTKVAPLHWGANTTLFDPTRHPRSSAAVAGLRRRYGIPDDAPVVGFVGSFRPWHGAAEALRAFRRVQDAIPDARLIFVGDGPEREALQAGVSQQSTPGIIFTGAVPYADVPAHLALCDVAVAPFAPSLHAPLRHFGFYWSPLKVFESMAMAVPVVTTAIPPLTEIVGGAGICVPERDIAALAAAICSLLLDASERKRMGETGRARVVAHWSWQAHCRALDRMLTDLVSSR